MKHFCGCLAAVFPRLKEMSFRPSDSSLSGGGRCCDMMGRRPSHGHHLWPEHNRHWRTSSSILFLVSSLLILAIANAHQQLPTAAGYAERTDEVMEGGRELLVGGTTGRQPGAAAASGETQSSRLPSDMVDVVVGRGRRLGQPKGAAASRERMEGGVEHQPPLLLHRRGRQAAPESTEMLSSSRIDHADIGTIMLDAKYPLSGFDDVNFDDSGGGIGPLSGLDESEIGRRLGGGSLLHYQATVTTPATTSHSANKGDESESEAAFSGALETNVTASLGQTAFLRCRLKNSKHQVTWIRIRDWHILTSGLLTYTADARFRIKHTENTEASEWTLEIKFLQKRDEGTYYCQIPTRTGAVVHAFHLHIASPQAVILGGQVSHVDIHTPSLTLVCIVDNTPDPPQVIFWYHNGTLLKDGKYPEMGVGGPGGGSGLISSHLTLTPSRTMSMLTIHEIQHIHSGNYTCRAPNAEPDTTQLFVTQLLVRISVCVSQFHLAAAPADGFQISFSIVKSDFE
ncbi:uncharacterized protein LOC124190212 isoform X2 [Daphnia pulex]|uniref:uncharacterized protein LOC124190212 isoform X2 n=1 Tax=Daphnia pulex TaxID=6669 RepID=UPI001EE040C6|nr:uncharacterized protein LOC124190212 isoform X2 [Daphnia pulex]